MNKQGKGKIEYLDFTWNPVTGCLHNCPYCYARKITNRFGTCSRIAEYVPDSVKEIQAEHGIIVELNERLSSEPYPYDFLPTFHRSRLDEPQKVKRPSVIGVVYMGDLFGDWVS